MFGKKISGVLDKVAGAVRGKKDDQEQCYEFVIWTGDIDNPSIGEYSSDILNLIESGSSGLKNAVYDGDGHEYNVGVVLTDENVIQDPENPLTDELHGVVIQEVKYINKSGIPEYFFKCIMPQNQSGNFLFKCIKKKIDFTFNRQTVIVDM